ncbi:foldase protein PrsA [Clostridium gelidum]|uniref:peptidylprolyl isomerase n=1 Tax=Clostridium gelidum TaxID=704125 RepID=A0ABN6IPZ3_9CLOT|nr:peptidylprolyl isomerase [Clostridium gelidum]BCZ44037.1 foldase protein PrsA [Clostridium gelidum]
MKKIKKIMATVAILTIAVSAMGCKMIEKTPEAIQKTVLATVGNEKITKGDFDKEMSKADPQLKQQLGADYATNDKAKDQLAKIKKQQLDKMVTEKILLQKATELNVKPSDDELNSKADEAISQLKAQYTEEGQLESALKQYGFTTEDEAKDYIKNQSILQAVQQDIIKDVTVTDDEVQTYYDENKDAKYSVGAGANVAHILISEKASDGTTVDYDASLQKANSLKAQIDGGADFATLAKANSIDGSKDKGGSLGFVAYNSTQLVPEFVAGFKDLKEGEVSQPVKSQFGYHIIKATGLKGAEVTPLDKVKDEIKATMLQQKQGSTFNDKIAEWKTDLKVKTNEDKL